jgi:hypothetical protein
MLPHLLLLHSLRSVVSCQAALELLQVGHTDGVDWVLLLGVQAVAPATAVMHAWHLFTYLLSYVSG